MHVAATLSRFSLGRTWRWDIAARNTDLARGPCGTTSGTTIHASKGAKRDKLETR